MKAYERFKYDRYILAQMHYLISKNVLPSWDNYLKFGDLWAETRRHLSREERARFQWAWMKIFRATFPAPTP